MFTRVFLSHSTVDKPAVEALARRLCDQEHIQVWLDKSDLIPGDSSQEGIEKALAQCEVCAVFLGPTGLGTWQDFEMRMAINRRVRERQRSDRFRVIPVFLPGARRDSLPGLLVDATWVEFRGSLDDPDAFHRLVCGIRGVAPGPGGPDARGSPRTTHNLPFAPNPAFTGRETDLENLGELLRKRGEVALTQTMVLHGLGGVGKTQLAVEYAWKHLGGYEAVLWVRADSRETLEANLARLAQALGLPEASAKEQSVQMDAVLGWLKRHERWLLVADNADTDEAGRAVRDRLAPNLGGHVLVTSRLGRWPTNMAHLPIDLLAPNDATRYLQDRVAKEGHQAGDETTARTLAEELGHLPLALEQAAAFIIELRWSFDKYRQRLRKLLDRHREGATRYPASVAKTWNITLERLSALARAFLRLTAWFAPDVMPRGIFSADPTILSEGLGESVEDLDLAIEEALGELARFSLIRLTPETVSVNRLLQAVEQDALTKEERVRWLNWAVRLFSAFAPEPDDVRTWSIWVALQPHAEALIKNTQSQGMNATPVAILANQYAGFLYARANYTQAEPLMRRALAIDEASFGPDHPDVAIDLNNLAQLLKATNRLSEAEPLMRRALAIDEASFGPDHPNVAIDLNNLAQLLQATNRLSEAEPLMRRALAIDEASFGPDHPNVAIDLNNLAQLLQATNRLSEAEPLMRRALAIDEASFGPDHPKVAIRLNNLAQLLKDTNRLSDAEPLMRRTVEILLQFRAAIGHEHPNLHAVIANYSVLLEEMGCSPAQIRVQLEGIVQSMRRF